MRIAILGLGYVGTVTAACLARDGHEVIGVDISTQKVEQLNAGGSPVVEPGLSELVGRGVQGGRLRATSDAAGALARADLCLVCVGTPSGSTGAVDLTAVRAVVADIGRAILARDGHLLVVVRSTVLPGTTRSAVLAPLTEATGRAPGATFDVAFHPEFLREGHAIEDYYNPPRIVIGEREADSARKLASLYGEFSAPLFRTNFEAAELVKYCDNAFHALKITFANEVGRVAQSFGVDPQQLMEMFCADKKLNLSAAYLRPGFSFGGSCLPKDLRALVRAVRQRDVAAPVLAAVLPSNDIEIQRAEEFILASGSRSVAFWGLTFKAGTDDLRESPLVRLAETLSGKGLSLRIYDPGLQLSRVVGRNRAFIDQRLPHLASMLVEEPADLAGADLVTIGHPAPGPQIEQWLAQRRLVLDLVGTPGFEDREGFSSIHGQWSNVVGRE